MIHWSLKHHFSFSRHREKPAEPIKERGEQPVQSTGLGSDSFRKDNLGTKIGRLAKASFLRLIGLASRKKMPLSPKQR
jgi:hypothetical protein